MMGKMWYKREGDSEYWMPEDSVFWVSEDGVEWFDPRTQPDSEWELLDT